MPFDFNPFTTYMADRIDNAGSPAPPMHSSFPQNPEDFDADPRISFSKVSNKFILETEHDGTEYEFDDKLKRWVLAVRPPHIIPMPFASRPDSHGFVNRSRNLRVQLV